MSNPRLGIRKKYLILREIVMWLGLFEYLGLGGGLYFLGSGDYQQSAVFSVLLAISYYISSRLSWYVNELLIRMATSKE